MAGAIPASSGNMGQQKCVRLVFKCHGCIHAKVLGRCYPEILQGFLDLFRGLHGMFEQRQVYYCITVYYSNV